MNFHTDHLASINDTLNTIDLLAREIDPLDPHARFSGLLAVEEEAWRAGLLLDTITRALSGDLLAARYLLGYGEEDTPDEAVEWAASAATPQWRRDHYFFSGALIAQVEWAHAYVSSREAEEREAERVEEEAERVERRLSGGDQRQARRELAWHRYDHRVNRACSAKRNAERLAKRAAKRAA